MALVTAQLNNYRQSPRKVRLVASLVKGKSVEKALTVLSFTTKEASGPLAKLVQSAVRNAKNNFNIEKEALTIKDFRVDKGSTLKRSMPRARGSANPIRKRTSHVILVLESK